jgi:hypothetical protein
MTSKITVSKSGIHGKGIIATRDIKKGEIVMIFKGKIIHWKVHDQKSSLCGPNWVGIGKGKWMDVLSPGVFLNHSCNPNCGIKGKVETVALRNIKNGEEITIDYSITEIDDMWYMKCNCGEKNCRKIIKSVQFLPTKQFLKYFPFIPTYFRNLYLKGHKIKLGHI